MQATEREGMNKTMQLTVDGRRIETEGGRVLLDILNEQGIQVPQLCSHPSLAPAGACRLCMVEITKKEWGGKSRLVASCLYPAEEGLVVSTRSPDVLQLRRSLLELYLARSPGSKVLKEMAALEGVDRTPFVLGEPADSCILCGLCTRVCRDYGPGAISTLGRGVEKYVGPDPGGIAADCTGCRACAHVCPTEAIPWKQQEGFLTIWGRRFEIAVCAVQPELCMGCGICEELCPISLPRVVPSRGGPAVSFISADACAGCGICAGACPAGAIEQKETAELPGYMKILAASNLGGKNVAFFCPRSPLPAVVNEDELIIPVSCAGSVDISALLYCIAAGANSAVLICRDRLSCPYGRGGEAAEKRAAVAADLLQLCGLKRDRVTLLNSRPGREGALEVWRLYISALSVPPAAPEALYSLAGGAGPGGGMELALDIVRWLKERPELEPALPPSLAGFFPVAAESRDALYLERLPELHLLLSLTMERTPVPDILAQAARLLKAHHIEARGLVALKERERGKADGIFTFTPLPASSLPAGASAVTLNELAAVEGAPEEGSFSFRPGRRERSGAADEPASEEGAPLLYAFPEQWLQQALLQRRGAWRRSRPKKGTMLFSASLPEADPGPLPSAAEKRIREHPILTPPKRPGITFTFNNMEINAREGEVISSALYAAGISAFGRHHRDGAPQGIFCVNGQCSQCTVIAGGKPVKACMTPVTPGMSVQSAEGLPRLEGGAPAGVTAAPVTGEIAAEVLIIGAGPAGMSAALELGAAGIDVLMVDDKQEPGGKLGLQTHNFFGSVADCHAGSRGMDIGRKLAADLKKQPTVRTMFNATVVGVFSDGKFGLSRNGSFKLVRPQRVLFATGAREKSLAFPGCDLPGVYGAGAFQTLVNRDLVRCAERIFIIGGGNVGLIGAYHALQAGIDVAGLVEAMSRCGGYKVHEDKIRRLGVPIWTSHTVLRAEGRERVERVIIAAVDENFKPLPGTERAFDVDTLLVAVGLDPVDELLEKAKEYGMSVYAAGDAGEIAEASAAIFSGRIAGRHLAQDCGADLPVPGHWHDFGEMLKHKPGQAAPFEPPVPDAPVYPLIRCLQEIPCNPCVEACPQGAITMAASILSRPEFTGRCTGCGRCVLACPGLAITLVMSGYDAAGEKALIMLPFEFNDSLLPLGQSVITTGLEGEVVGRGRVVAYKDREEQNRRRLLLLEVPYGERLKVAGFRIRDLDEGRSAAPPPPEEADPIVCRCERVRKSEIVREIRAGVRDMNQLKALLRTGMGGCGGKTCTDLILRIYREEGVPLSEITLPTHRPLVAEMHLGDFVAKDEEEGK